MRVCSRYAIEGSQLLGYKIGDLPDAVPFHDYAQVVPSGDQQHGTHFGVEVNAAGDIVKPGAASKAASVAHVAVLNQQVGRGSEEPG